MEKQATDTQKQFRASHPISDRRARIALYRDAGLPIDTHETEEKRQISIDILDRCRDAAEEAGDEDYRLMFEAALAHLNGPDYPAQIAKLRQAIKWIEDNNLPEDYYIIVVLGIFLILDETSDPQEAVNWCKKGTELEPFNSDTFFWLGRAQLKALNYDEALHCFDAAVAFKPLDCYTMYWMGCVLHNMKQFDLAQDCFERANYISFTAREIPHWLGKAMLLRRESGSKYRWIDYTLDIRPDYFDPMLGKASVFHFLDKFDRVIQWADRVLCSDETDPDSLYERGIALCLTDKNKEAVECFKNVLAIQPWNNMAMYWMGISFADDKDYESALYWYDKALEIDPNDSECLMRKGIVLGLTSQYEKAIDSLNKSITLNVYNVGALQCLGITYSLIEDHRKALDCYNSANKMNPEDNTILFRKGELHHVLGEFDEALDCFNQALKIYPEDYDVLFARVKTLHEARKKEKPRQIIQS
ncbi:MAG: tetratricopeptide repeat protein [Thermoguttaceae bacterium]